MANAVSINSKGDQRLALNYAILVYGRGDQAFAMLHDVEHRRSGWRLLTGKIATRQACADFARSITAGATFGDFISPAILYTGASVTAWWRPPAAARVWFKCEDKRIGTRSAVTPQPGLVFVLAFDRWFVYAVKGSARPTPATRLFFAPYFNIWKDHQLCEGNIERPERLTTATIQAFEQAFFGSRFTHPNDGGIARGKGGVWALWQALLAGKHKRFPEELLAPDGKLTLEQCMRAHQGGKHGRA